MENKAYNVYQVQKIDDIYTYTGLNSRRWIGSYDIKCNIIGSYSGNLPEMSQLPEKVWNLCNASCWKENWKQYDPVEESGIVFNPTAWFQGYCNSDIMVDTPDGLYLAKPFGWAKIESLKEGIYRIMHTFSFIRLDEIRDKSWIDMDYYNKIGETIKKEMEGQL